MKEMIINTKVKVCTVDELPDADREVVDAARAATANSYAIYSHFNVGAAVRLANGIIVSGSNQENAAYPSGLCAERTTLFWANSQYPTQPVEVLAIAARNEQGELATPIPPCGACRQVMSEFCSHDFKVILVTTPDGDYVEETLANLLPYTFKL